MGIMSLLLLTSLVLLQVTFIVGQPTPKYTSEAEQDRVHTLPGAKNLDFGLFSG